MQIATTPTNGEILDKEDPYRYGWREVPRQLDDGSEVWDRIPLTLEDILHPQVGDFRIQDDEHQRFRVYLYDVMSLRIVDEPNTIVLSKVRVAWAHPDVKAHGPDIAVIFNLRRRINWETFDEKEEGTKPSLIIEIAVPLTRKTDVVSKVKEYAMVGVPNYIIVDRFERSGVMIRELVGYQLTPKGYEKLSPNEDGWLWLSPVKIWLSIDGGDLVCYDEAGVPIPDHVGEVRARVAAEERADEETQARVAAETRADEEAQARVAADTRADEEAQARVAAEARAAEEAQARAEEAQARVVAEERTRQLEAKLQRRTP